MSEQARLKIHRRSAGVAQITMSRADVFNAFDEAMIAELDSAFRDLVEDDNVRVIVLAGDGKHFSAGADLKWMQRASQESREWNLADARRFAAMLGNIDACPKPTLARIQGAALGGGVGLAAVEVGKAIGARVIATAGGAAKLGLAEAHGADALIDSRQEDIRQRVLALTDGRGADVVLDPVGGEVFEASLRATAWGGRILVIGFASGQMPQIPAGILLVNTSLICSSIDCLLLLLACTGYPHPACPLKCKPVPRRL